MEPRGASLKVIKPVHSCADENLRLGSREEKVAATPQTLGMLPLTFSLTSPTCRPGRTASSCFHQQGAQRELHRLYYSGKKLMVAATAVLLFLSGNLQGHFKVKRNLILRQVPRFCYQAGCFPQPGAGFARDPEQKGPNFVSLFKRRKKGWLEH